MTWRYLWLQTIAGLMVAGTLGLLSALAARGGIALRLMSIAIVTRNGTLASGSRTWLRAVLSWLPVLAASAAVFAGHSPLLTLTPQAAQFLVVSPMGLPVFFPNEPSIPVRQTGDHYGCSGRVRARCDLCSDQTRTGPPGSPGRHMVGAALGFSGSALGDSY